MDNWVTDKSLYHPAIAPSFSGALFKRASMPKPVRDPITPDNRRGVIAFGKQFLCLKLTEGTVEATVRFDGRSNLRQIAERTMH